MAKTVAHLVYNYLGLSETFIYDQITRHIEYKPIVLTNRTQNLGLFPFPDIRISPQPYGIEWAFDRAWFHTMGDSLKFEWIMRRESVSIMHAHYGTHGIYACSIKKRVNIPLITSFYGFDASRILKQDPRAYNILFKEGDLFLAVSEFLRQRLIGAGCPKEKVLVQLTGIDLKRFPYKLREPPHDGKIRLLHVGRLVEKKGLIVLINALPKVLEEHPNISLTVIGEGPEREKIEAQANQLGVGKHVQLLGAQNRVRIIQELLDSHIFVLPSLTAQDGDTEGLPTVILEAQATGMPIVATHHAGIPEEVVEGETGELAKEGDVDDLCTKLVYLLDRPEIWGKYGNAGRQHIEKNFDITRQVARLEDIYDGLLSK
jgi:colanic acid/amylovoran biosynthesis glycosyltransferase